MKQSIKKLTAILIFVLALSISGCGGDKKTEEIKNTPTPQTTEEVKGLEGYEISYRIDKSEETQLSIPIELKKSDLAKVFSIQGITLTVGGTMDLKDLIIREGKLTQNWIFRSNYDEPTNQIKAGFMNLAPIEVPGNIFYIDIPLSKVGDIAEKKLSVTVEIADGVDNFALPTVDIPLS